MLASQVQVYFFAKADAKLYCNNEVKEPSTGVTNEGAFDLPQDWSREDHRPLPLAVQSDPRGEAAVPAGSRREVRGRSQGSGARISLETRESDFTRVSLETWGSDLAGDSLETRGSECTGVSLGTRGSDLAGRKEVAANGKEVAAAKPHVVTATLAFDPPEAIGLEEIDFTDLDDVPAVVDDKDDSDEGEETGSSGTHSGNEDDGGDDKDEGDEVEGGGASGAGGAGEEEEMGADSIIYRYLRATECGPRTAGVREVLRVYHYMIRSKMTPHSYVLRKLLSCVSTDAIFSLLLEPIHDALARALREAAMRLTVHSVAIRDLVASGCGAEWKTAVRELEDNGVHPTTNDYNAILAHFVDQPRSPERPPTPSPTRSSSRRHGQMTSPPRLTTWLSYTFKLSRTLMRLRGMLSCGAPPFTTSSATRSVSSGKSAADGAVRLRAHTADFPRLHVANSWNLPVASH
ncbi:hypothetical protein BDK51DRAFT_45874 [Blyttiomyces helicus]|uniref:Uncharacterized protein n=1 Tax=Blyttiomyces helicus TaxID=388810 RepID=A0A4P9WBY0_9FUNG|nr:hypothetical protein BDK51DRAFT_45874 [Blyttiomyces helicus]|eukprot:RKO89083.1 hypothetical protein BDK51DRAFT_45874 [Blyttiomyces helicus]